MADEDFNQRFDRIETALAEMRAAMVTKADIDQLRLELATKTDLADLAVETARSDTALRQSLDLLAGVTDGMVTAMQALSAHQLRLSERVRRLEISRRREG